MELRILGSLEVVGRGGRVELTSKQGALLVALALNANELVATDVLVERLWPEPPVSAAKLVQVYVSQLRAALGPDGERISTRTPGYVLALAAEEVDSGRFERLVDEGRTALGEGNPARARRALRQALRLWRGSALAEFAYDDFARLQAERLEELRLAAREDLFAAELALGEHEEALSELRSLVEQHPLRERLWQLRMLALYRSGRQAEALECYAHARRTLRDELGLEPSEELRGLQQAILQHDSTLSLERPERPRRTNLPAAVSPLFGRDDDVAEIRDLLLRRDVRLLTLAGAGGSGKTTLALEVARALVDEFANGAFAVELAPIRDVRVVPAAIAEALRLDVPPGMRAREALVEFLGSQELLLVVDNAEHLTEIGPLIVELLEAAARIKVLVTSRVVLHLSCERIYPVQPLEPGAAAELFRARAAASAPSSSELDASFVADICRRLDNLPLAIELAAPHLRTFTLEQLHERLSARLPLLTGGPRDLPARQQTLRDTIAWSHALLEPPAQRLLAALSVFDGGFTIEAAEDVCGTLADPVATHLGALVDANLVRRHHGSRLELLETIREFAQERLQESRDPEATKRRHAQFFLKLAESAHLSVDAIGGGEAERFEIVHEELPNLRAGLDWAAGADPELGLRLTTALEQFWVTHRAFEGIDRFEAFLERAHDADPILRGQALRALAGARNHTGNHAAAKLAYRQGLALFETAGDELGVATMTYRLGINAVFMREYARARPLLERSLQRFRELGSRRGECEALGALSSIALRTGESREGRRLGLQSAGIANEIGWTWWEAGRFADLSREALGTGELELGERWARETLQLGRPMGGTKVIGGLALLAYAAALRGDAERAGTLRGALDAEEANGVAWGLLDHYSGPLDTVAGPEFDRAREAGRLLSLDEAVAYALEDGRERVPGSSPEQGFDVSPA